MNLEEIQMEIIKEEGGIILKPYQDHLGFWTIGAGHLIREHEKTELMRGITYEQGLAMFLKDFNVSVKDMETFSDGMELPDIAKECILHMVFQLGLPKLNKFKKFKQCLMNKNFDGAIVEMKDSRWYNQTTNRANRLIEKMKKLIE